MYVSEVSICTCNMETGIIPTDDWSNWLINAPRYNKHCYQLSKNEERCDMNRNREFIYNTKKQRPTARNRFFDSPPK